MDRKKILIVSRSFYPMISPRSFRTTELVKEFARQGHDVTLLTQKNNKEHVAFEKEHDVTIKDFGTAKWKPVNISGNSIVRMYKRVMGRMSNLLFEYPDIELMPMVSKALKKESGYDLMISVAVPYPVHWGVARARRKRHPIAKVWVADCGDPYMGGENDTFQKFFYFKYVEKWFSKKADYLAVPTTGAIQAYYPEFHNKIKVIPQGFRFEDIKLHEGETGNKVPTFAYAGGFILGRRDPAEFLTYLNSLDRDFRFHIFTNHLPMVERYARQSNGRIIIEKTVPREQLLYQLSKMDFVVNFENVGTKQTPSKLIDYAIINKPVISVKTGQINKGVIDEFLNADYRHGLEIPNPDQYRIENVARQFLELT